MQSLTQHEVCCRLSLDGEAIPDPFETVVRVADQECVAFNDGQLYTLVGCVAELSGPHTETSFKNGRKTSYIELTLLDVRAGDVSVRIYGEDALEKVPDNFKAGDPIAISFLQHSIVSGVAVWKTTAISTVIADAAKLTDMIGAAELASLAAISEAFAPGKTADTTDEVREE